MKRFISLTFVCTFFVFVSCNQKSEKENKTNAGSQELIKQEGTSDQEIVEQEQQGNTNNRF